MNRCDKWTIFAFCVMFFTLAITGAAKATPTLDNYVNDFANVLSESEETQLNILCSDIDRNTTYEIAIVTVLNTEGDDRLHYANVIGEVNGVGKEYADNGIVILYSLDNEKGGAIAVGRGAEGILTDSVVSRIGRASKDKFDDGNYYAGFEYIVNNIQNELSNVQSTSNNIPATINISDMMQPIPSKHFIILMSCIVILFLLVNLFIDNSSSTRGDYVTYSPSYSRNHYRNSTIRPYNNSSTSSSSNTHESSTHSGGSFGGFGGGSFGGGGGKF